MSSKSDRMLLAKPENPRAQAVDPLIYPCSLQQLRFWAMDHLSPGHAGLNAAFRCRLTGYLCTRTLEKAFRQLVCRHEALRTALIEEGGEPVQYVYEMAAFSLPVVDLSLLNDEEATKEADRLVSDEAQTPFDLASPPLLRARLLRLSSQEAIILLTVHQAACDGWSAGILVRELGEIYSALLEGRKPKLPDLKVTYSDFAVWQRKWGSGEELKNVAKSYQAKYAGASYFEVPPDLPLPAHTWPADIVSLLIEKEVAHPFLTLARFEGCTFFMASLSALLVTLNRYTGETDITVGTEVAAREEVELENVVGYFANTILLQGDLSADPSFREVLSRVRDLVLTEFDNRHLPYEKLIEFLRPRPRIGRNPLFSVNFIVQRAFVESSNWAKARLSNMPSVSAGALYDLSFFLVERSEGWRLSCEYKTGLFKRETILCLLDEMLKIMRIAVSTPDLAICAYPAMSRLAPRRSQPKSMLCVVPAVRPPEAYLRPLKKRERFVAEIWGRVLPTAPIAPDDDFFDLGGDFWQALRLAKEFEEETGLPFRVVDIFERPSLESYASRIDEGTSIEDCSEVSP